MWDLTPTSPIHVGHSGGWTRQHCPFCRDEIEGACEAMSRFLLFVHLEAVVSECPRDTREVLGKDAVRAFVLGVCIKRGRIRMSWGRP